jgi:nicotinate-nucleotide adenylyltransferase
VRLGVLGGTFDPPHLGHLVVASEVAERLKLDRLLWIPSALHPLKGGGVAATARQRLEMVQAAVAGDPRFAADPLELERSGPSYTVDTLRELRARHPAAELFFVAGADILRELHLWKSAGEVARLARLVVVTRGGDAAAAGAVLPLEAVRVTRIDLSSTEVRRRVAAGESIRYLVPEAVIALIERWGLYRDATLLRPTEGS